MNGSLEPALQGVRQAIFSSLYSTQRTIAGGIGAGETAGVNGAVPRTEDGLRPKFGTGPGAVVRGGTWALGRERLAVVPGSVGNSFKGARNLAGKGRVSRPRLRPGTDST